MRQVIRCGSLNFVLFVLFLALAQNVEAQIKWTRTLGGQNKVVNFRPGSQGTVVYAAPHDSIGSINISWNGGYSWLSVAGEVNPIEPNGRNFTRQLWLDPNDSNNVLLGSSDQRIGVYQSKDAGRNWTQVIPDATILGESIFELQDGSGVLYCGVSGETTLFKSIDRGTTWTPEATIEAGSPNICVIAGKPGSSTDFLVGSGGGIISLTKDAGKTWKQVHPASELGLSDVPMIAFNPKDPNEAIATLYFYNDTSVVKTNDGGETWRRIEAPSNQWALKIDASDPDIIYMGRFSALDTIGGTLFRSSDGGESWDDLGMDSITDIWQIDYDTSSGRLTMATSNGIFIGETKEAAVHRQAGSSLAASVTVNFTAKQLYLHSEIGASVEIIDVNGRKLTTREIVEERSTLDVAAWPQGVYFAHFRHKNGYALRRFTLLR